MNAPPSSDNGSHNRAGRTALTIALSYALFGGLWITGSGYVLHRLLDVQGTAFGWEIAKGGIFVLVTAALLWLTLDKYLRRTDRAMLLAQRSEHRRRSLFENMLDGVTYCRMIYEDGAPQDFVYLEVNDAFEKLTGLKDVVGKRATEVFPGIRESDPVMFETYGRVALSGIPERFEAYRTALNKWFYVSVYSPGTEHFTAVLEDITERKRAEMSLQEREEQLRLFADHSPAAVAMFDRDMKYLVASRRWREDYRIGDLDIVGQSHYEVCPEIPQRWIDVYHRCMRGAVEKCEEDPVLRADGRTDWIRWEVWPWYQADGTIGGIIIFSEDITDRKRAQAAQKESEERLRLLGDNLPDSYVFQYTRDEDGAPRFLHLSAGVERVHELNVSDVLRDAGLLLSQIAPEQTASFLAEEAASRQNMTDFEMELRVHLPSGTVHWMSVLSHPRRNPDGNVIWDGVATDITERKLAEERIREQASLLDLAHDGIVVCDMERRIRYWNKGNELILGWTADEVMGRRAEDLLQLEAGLIDSVMQILLERGQRTGEIETTSKDGRTVTLLSRATLLRDAQGLPKSMLIINTDVTESKAAQRALEFSERRLGEAMDLAQAAAWEFDAASAMFTFNDRFYALYGTSAGREGGYTMPASEYANRFLFPEDVHIVEREIARALNAPGDETSWQLEHRILRRDGETRHVLVRILTVRDERGRTIKTRGVNQDITDRKQTEEERARLAIALEQAAEAFVITDAEGTILYVNPAFEWITGYQRSEAIGQNPRILKSGAQDETVYQDLWATLARGEVWSGRVRNKRKDKRLYDAELTIAPVVDRRGNIVNYVATQRDITEQLELERRLRQSQKMQAMGTLAGGIAHDFNNILGAIMGYGQLVSDELPEGSQCKADIDEMMAAARRAADLVHQILTFSRQVEEERQRVDVGIIVKEALKLLRPSLTANIEIVTAIGSEDCLVLADPTQIHQVLMNLCTNAYHAMAGASGTLTVEVEPHTIDLLTAESHPGLKKGDYIRLTVSDTGHGIDEENIERIFEPFFTTKPVGQGTGLGLATVHGIVTSHGGTVSVYSDVGKGTTFHVYLPRVGVAGSEPIESEEPVRGGREQILVLDDDVALARLLSRMLEQLGYEVTVKTDPREALETFHKDPARFDLVITDHTMPKITGAEIVVDIRRLRPEVPIIVTTGHAGEPLKEQLADAGVFAVITKPFRQSDIARTVRAALDA